MGNVRGGECATCRARVLWLRPFGFAEPRPVEPAAAADGEVVVDVEGGRYRHVVPGEPVTGPRFRLHWPCPRSGGWPPAAALDRDRTVDVSVVAHTHWDREWYEPFEGFRARLVDVVDEVLDVLDADSRFAAFHLDGYTALVDDYLEARPEAEDRVRRLVADGRLVVGPWEILADEFLVSGETLVRNLRRGVRRSRDLGGVMPVGYLPDQFGHTAQLPQILALAGIGDVVVFRGVPDAVGRTRFVWEAPDGTPVRAEHLPMGYCNANRFEDDPKRVLDRMVDTEVMLGERRVGDVLLMNGCDHLRIQPWVPATLARANALQGRYRFTMRRLDDHVSRQPGEGLPVWRGELRSPGPAAFTPGVTSNRVDVRLATAAAERAVERRAEPLAALLLPADRWPGGLLDLAWGHLVRNSAHDSICACSADEVVREVMVRAGGARAIGEQVVARSVAALAGAVDAPPGSVLVVNPSPSARTSAVEAAVAGRGACHLVSPDGTALATQVLREDQAVELDVTASGDGLDAVVALLGTDRAAGHRVASWSVDDDEGAAEITLTVAAAGAPATDLGPVLDRLAEWRAERPPRPVRLVVLHPPTRTVLALPGEVPGFGWAAPSVADGPGPATAVAGGARWIANEHLRVDVEERGTLRVTTAGGTVLTGLARLVDGGDAGDVYDHSPPTTDVVVEEPEAVRVQTLETGPVRARLAVTRAYRWPVAVERDGHGSRRSEHTEPVEVRTVVDLVAGEAFVRLAVELDHRARDHRVRLHLPLPAPVNGSDAEAAFAVVHRGLLAEGNPLEAAQPTHPSMRFVDCSDGSDGLAVVHDGVAEFEVVGGGRELAVTLLRATGWLSRDDGSNRPAAAGPAVPLPDAQVPGPYRRRLALVPHCGTWEDAGLPRVADDVLVPLEVSTVAATTTGTRPAVWGRLSARGAEVTSLVRRGGGLELRAVRLATTPGVLEVSLDGRRAEGAVVDLHGATVGHFHGAIALRPWEIVTVRVEEPPAGPGGEA